MSTPPGELPPPPPPMTPPASATQIVGQQVAPSTAVPAGPPGGMPGPAPGQTNTLAVVSLVTAIAAPFGHFIGVGGITLIVVSLVTGHMARAQIKKTGEGGATLALVGLIISYVHLALTALVVIFFFGAIITLMTFLIHAAIGH